MQVSAACYTHTTCQRTFSKIFRIHLLVHRPKVKKLYGNLANCHYNNNVHFEGVRFICGPHLAIIGPSGARAD